jgi:hypothetical protein
MTGFDKDVIEACIREVVLALAERLDAPEGIALEFTGIGRLSLRRRKLKFTFYSNFEEAPQALEGRPPTRWGLRCGAQQRASCPWMPSSACDPISFSV